jgi:hypothetical protein
VTGAQVYAAYREVNGGVAWRDLSAAERDAWNAVATNLCYALRRRQERAA